MNILKMSLLAGTAAMLMPVAGYAESAAESGADADRGLADIVVTARRRAENIQTVPVAITAITADTLREKSISNPYDLVSSTPGLSATSGSSQRNDVLFFIRGQGATFGSTPSVVTYFADVPQQTYSASGGSNITFFDLESIQVLKGPQGTLFGRSSTAGAVLLSPKKPTGEFDGFFEAGIGNYDAREFSGAINVPLIGDRLAIRVAGNHSEHRGYMRSITTGQDLDDKNRTSFRVSLLARPTEWLTNTTIFHDTKVDENGTGAQLWHYYPNRSANGLYNPLTDTTNTGNPATSGLGYLSAAGLCGSAALAGYVSATYGSVGACIDSRVARINAVAAGLQTEYDRLQGASKKERRRLATGGETLFLKSHTQQVINTTEIEFGKLGFLGDTSLKNTFSASKVLQATAIREIQGSPVPTGVVYNDLNFINGKPVDTGRGRSRWGDIWSEEVQFSGKANDKHDWIIGFFKESSQVNQYMNSPAVFLTLNGAFTVPEGIAGLSNGFNRNYLLTQTGYFGQTTLDMGEFGLEGLRFTAGYRHSIVKNKLDEVKASITPNGIVFATPSSVVSANLKQKADSYTFALDYRVNSDILVYATTRKGFKQGGINIQSVPLAATIPAAKPYFAPEKVTDYEAGIKADWSAGSVDGRTNLAVFSSKYTNLHRANSFFNGQTTSNQIENIAGAKVKGIELENTFRLTEDFTVNMAYAYIDAKYNKYPGTIYNSDGVLRNRIDAPFTGTPKHKIDMVFQYKLPVGEDVRATVNYSYQSKIGISDDGLFSADPEVQNGYSLVNARLDWNNVMGNPIDASLYVRNLTNKLYAIGAGNLVSSGLGTTTRLYGDPRTFGVQVRARFGASAE